MTMHARNLLVLQDEALREVLHDAWHGAMHDASQHDASQHDASHDAMDNASHDATDDASHDAMHDARRDARRWDAARSDAARSDATRGVVFEDGALTLAPGSVEGVLESPAFTLPAFPNWSRRGTPVRRPAPSSSWRSRCGPAAAGPAGSPTAAGPTGAPTPAASPLNATSTRSSTWTCSGCLTAPPTRCGSGCTWAGPAPAPFPASLRPRGCASLRLPTLPLSRPAVPTSTRTSR